MNILLQCAPLANPTCFSPVCLQRTRNQAILAMQQASNLTSIPFNITADGPSRRLTLRLVYVGVVLLRKDRNHKKTTLTFVVRFRTRHRFCRCSVVIGLRGHTIRSLYQCHHLGQQNDTLRKLFDHHSRWRHCDVVSIDLRTSHAAVRYFRHIDRWWAH